eukprot:6440373-Pyramimonas_sp.AAC.1
MGACPNLANEEETARKTQPPPARNLAVRSRAHFKSNWNLLLSRRVFFVAAEPRAKSGYT